MHMLQLCFLLVLQHELIVVKLKAAPSGLRAQDSKAAFLGGCVTPTWKRLNLKPALLFCSDTRSASTYRWAYLVVACETGEEIHQGPTIIKICLVLLPFINSKN